MGSNGFIIPAHPERVFLSQRREKRGVFKKVAIGLLSCATFKSLAGGMARMDFVAIGVAAFAGFAIGSLWYSPLGLLKPWARAVGWTDEGFKRARQQGLAFSLLLSFGLSVITAAVIEWLLRALALQTWYGGALIGLLLWLGCIATTYLDRVLWEGRPFVLYAITAGHYFVVLLVMGAIIGGWP